MNVINIIALLAIPILISLSWLIGGSLIHQMPPVALAFSRLLIGTIILFFFSSITELFRTHSKKQNIIWWRNQIILSLTGRVLYFYLSSLALLTISPFEAILISTILPLIIMLLDFLILKKMRPKPVAITSMIAIITTIIAIGQFGEKTFDFNRGHLYMIVAMAFFALHLFYYRQKVKESSATNPLFAQFLFGSAVLLPFALDSLSVFSYFTTDNWIQLFVYSVACNLLPFVLVHFCLRKFDPFLVGTISILSPLFSFAFKDFFGYENAPISFYFLTITAGFFVFMAAWLDHRSKETAQ